MDTAKKTLERQSVAMQVAILSTMTDAEKAAYVERLRKREAAAAKARATRWQKRFGG